jgi:tetratricopeptide (TPR) repeat protein
MNQRLTRKEIKHDIREDSFRLNVQRAFEYLAANLRLVIAVAAGIVLVVLVGLGARAWLNHRAAKASELLGRALIVHEAPIQANGTRPDHPTRPSFPDEQSRRQHAAAQFEEIRQKYPRSGAAAVARVYLGRIRLDEGQPEQARELWQEFLRRRDDHMLASTVRLSLYALEREAGRSEEVAAELRGMLEARRKPLPEDVVLYELALTLDRLGNQEEARSTYQRLGDEYPDSPYAQPALSRARELSPAAAAS